MGHYIRVLGTRDVDIPVKDISSALRATRIPLSISVDGKKPDTWAGLEFTHADGSPICGVERARVAPGELGATEIEEFHDEMKNAKPESAAEWLRRYLPNVRVIYAIQIYSGADRSYCWDVVNSLREVIWQHVGGIIQADWEGFSNEEGYHILWQFSDGVEGEWRMAVLDSNGEWIRFQMDLGNRKQRAAFLGGDVPKGAELLD